MFLYRTRKMIAPGQGTRPTNSCRPLAFRRRDLRRYEYLKAVLPPLLGSILFSFLSLKAPAQPFWPTEVGATVNGFQDDFGATTLDPNWVVAGANVYSVSSGQLHVNSATGDPNHLLYELPGYDNTTQEVLARIRVLSLGSGDLVRGGIGVGVDHASTQGINYLFRDNN